MQLRSKKGITLVEVIISAVLIAMIVGVTASIFLTGNNIYYEGAGVSRSFGECATVETYLQRNLMRAQLDPTLDNPAASNIKSSIRYADPASSVASDEIAFYFDSNGVFTIKTGKGTVTTYKTVNELSVTVTPTGTEIGSPFSAKYKIATSSDYKLNGGIVMPNTGYNSATSSSDPTKCSHSISPNGTNKCIIIKTGK